MAVTVVDESLHHATEALVLPSPRKYYKALLHADHWQLRSLISSPKEDIVYYPCGSDIYRLDTLAREREIIATIPFPPRCLTAAAGWICCGGEGGCFACIRLEAREGRSSFVAGRRADADTRLPLDLESARRTQTTDESAPIESRTGGYPLYAKATKIGEELVNCVTLWFPKSDTGGETYTKPVALLSSNDHSVTIVDLESRSVIEKLELDDCVNRAIMSPDGRLLVAIGDDPYMHVYHRKPSSFNGKNTSTRRTSHDFKWVKCQRIHLLGQRSVDKSEMRGSFATSFSPTGRYLAVGTQYGIITVFESKYLTIPDADAPMVTFTTSRPNHRLGAVRAMEFSPEPYDLLAWTEDHGRVAIADVRHAFMSRQIITMDPSVDGLESIPIIDRSEDLVIDPRLRQFRIDPEGNTSDSIGAEMERRQLRYLSREGLDRVQSPLTPEDTEVLEAIQLSRRQREREAFRQTLTGSTPQSPPLPSDSVDDIRSNWRDQVRLRDNLAIAADETRPSGRDFAPFRTSNTIPASLREVTRPTESFRAFVEERNQERERRGQQPRRRGSIILSAAGTALNRDLQAASERQRPHELATGGNRVTLTPPRIPTIRLDSPNNPWAEMETHYNLGWEPAPLDATTRMRIEIAADYRRQYARRFERALGIDEHDLRPVTVRSAVENSNRSNIPLEPMETTGCCWSRDGKILYVGAENGIFEYHVNIVGRKLFPSISFL